MQQYLFPSVKKANRIIKRMKKSRLYTGGGDSGSTSLVGGERILKSSLRLDAYGTVDEFSAFLGVLAACQDLPDYVVGQLHTVQNMLFEVGGYLASKPGGSGLPPVAALEESCNAVEGWIDTLDSQTPELREFILPGGCMSAAHAHVARTVCRRSERRIIHLAETEEVDPLVIRYFNRLSDYLFILARHLNHLSHVKEITWQKI